VTIDGGALGAIQLDSVESLPSNALRLTGGSSTVRRLVITRFAVGIATLGPGAMSILDSIIGTNPRGDAGLGNSLGVHLRTPDSVVRGNVVAGNDSTGILLESAPRAVIAGAHGNRIGFAAGREARFRSLVLTHRHRTASRCGKEEVHGNAFGVPRGR